MRAPLANILLDTTNSISRRLSVWEKELKNDFDKDFLLEGIRCGFKISDLVDYSVVKDVEVNNHPSALRYGDLVEKELVKQIEFHHYEKCQIKPTVVSPLGAILKDSGEVRIIHDGSRPLGEAMNNYSELYSVKYQTLQDAYTISKPNMYLAKVDLKAAYRSVAIHPQDYALTGIKWKFSGEDKESYLIDKRLPFGARQGCNIFHRLSQSVKRMMQRMGYNNIVCYLDDFFIAEDSFEKCQEVQQVLILLLGNLGFYVSWNKVLGPCKKLTFLGIVIDTENCSLSLDAEKLEKLKYKLEKFRLRKRAKKRQLQSLVGILNWACQAVRGGRFFLRRILDVMNSLKQANHKAKLSQEFMKDVHWWLTFLDTFNGVVYYRVADKLVVHTDACNEGAGAFCNGDWIYSNWAEDCKPAVNLHINYKEVLAVIIAARRWGETWKNTEVTVCTDSTVTKAIINKGTCKNPYVMSALRELFCSMVKYDFKLHAIHIPGVLNEIPDSISRLHDPYQLLRLNILLNNWFHHPFYSFDLKLHMSSRSLQVLLRIWYGINCKKKFLNIEQQHSR